MKRWFWLAVILFILPSTILATNSLDDINQKVCNRFEEDTARLAGIMEELRRRKGIKETRVAFGGVNTPIKSADYWITFAAEAVSYQRVQKYNGKNDLRYSLELLRGKVLKAKSEVGKALE